MKKYRVEIKNDYMKEAMEDCFDFYDYVYGVFMKHPDYDIETFMTEDAVIMYNCSTDKNKLLTLNMALESAFRKLKGKEEIFDFAAPKFPVMGFDVEDGESIGPYEGIFEFFDVDDAEISSGFLTRQNGNYYVVDLEGVEI